VRLSSPKEFMLADKPIYSGNYTGLWADATLGSLQISAIIYDDYSGILFYTKNYLPCCGGISDAVITMSVNGTAISSFHFSQYLGDYKGGHCVTTADATGNFLDDINLVLNAFPFTDCDGSRQVDTFKLTRAN